MDHSRAPTPTVRRAALIAVAIGLVPLGFATKLYAGPGEYWVRASAGGVIYVLFWSLLLVAARPRAPVRGSLLIVLGLTCALEFLQLWNPPVLAAVRATSLGHALLGSTFAWSDFPAYLAGSLVAAGIVRLLTASPDHG